MEAVSSMKRIIAWMTALCLLVAPVLAENVEKPEAVGPVERSEKPRGLEGGARGERPEGMEIGGGGRGQGGPGGAGGMATGEPDEAVQALIDEGLGENFVTFTKDTTVAGSATGSEHLTSFDDAYRLEAVHGWLFAQSK